MALFNDFKKNKMIIAKLKWNTRLAEVDYFIQKFTHQEKFKNFDVSIKLTDTACLIYFTKKLH